MNDETATQARPRAEQGSPVVSSPEVSSESDTVADVEGQGEPDYDDLPHDDMNPLWEVAIAMGILFAVLAAAMVALG